MSLYTHFVSENGKVLAKEANLLDVPLEVGFKISISGGVGERTYEVSEWRYSLGASAVMAGLVVTVKKTKQPWFSRLTENQ